MPSPHASYGRDYTAVNIQFDATDDPRHKTAYQNKRRDAIAGHNLTARRRTGSGWAVQPRNGVPVRLRAVIDTLGCGCVRRLLPAVMDWELISHCGGHHA